MARKLTKAQLKRKRQRIARQNFGSRSKVKTMARRKTSRRRVARKTTRRIGKKGIMSNRIVKGAIGAVLVAGYEAGVSPRLPGGQIKNLVETGVGVGLLISPKVPGALKVAGGLLAGINVVQMAIPFFARFTGGAGASSQGGMVIHG